MRTTATAKSVLDDVIGMADRKITLFELHFDRGFQIGPKTIGVGGDGEEEAEELEADADEEEFEDESDSSGPGGAGKALLALVALAGIALVVKRILGGDDDDEDPFEDEEQAEIEEFEPA